MFTRNFFLTNSQALKNSHSGEDGSVTFDGEWTGDIRVDAHWDEPDKEDESRLNLGFEWGREETDYLDNVKEESIDGVEWRKLGEVALQEDEYWEGGEHCSGRYGEEQKRGDYWVHSWKKIEVGRQKTGGTHLILFNQYNAEIWKNRLEAIVISVYDSKYKLKIWHTAMNKRG